MEKQLFSSIRVTVDKPETIEEGLEMYGSSKRPCIINFFPSRFLVITT